LTTYIFSSDSCNLISTRKTPIVSMLNFFTSTSIQNIPGLVMKRMAIYRLYTYCNKACIAASPLPLAIDGACTFVAVVCPAAPTNTQYKYC
jgi:hypothetical protein